MTKAPKVAIVADFLTTMGGAENVVLALAEAFPGAPIYTAVYDPSKVPAFAGLDVRTSRLQRLPHWLRKSYKLLPTLAVRAMRDLDLADYDVIIASTYLHGHQVTKARSDQTLIAYCHTPPRYYWSHYDLYRQDPGYGKLNPLVRGLMPLMVPRQRKLDLEAAANVDVFIANSTETARRIKKYYSRGSTVIHPPVDIGRFSPARERGDYYVSVGRQLPNKYVDLAIAACTKLSLPLKVIGNGPVHEKLESIAGPTIEFHTDRTKGASDKAVEEAFNNARGFVFPSDEDFGIVAVEALAGGTPVIAYEKSGTRDIVEDGVSGVLFKHQTVDDVIAAIKRAESMTFLPATLQRKSKRFAKSLFLTKIRKVAADAHRY